MAKKELHRKIIATVLTALALGAALALCIVLLVSSPVFSGALRITMLVCTVALAVAIVGLVVCKVQEIRTLAEIVRLDKQAPQRTAPAQEGEAQPPAPPANRAAPQPAAAPNADEAEEADADLEMQQPSLTVSMPAPEPAAAPVQQHNWKPLNFSSFRQQTPSGRSREEAERAVQQAAQAAQQQAERAAQHGAAEAEAERQRQLAAQQAAYAAQQQAAQLEAQRRAEQIRLAQAARTGGAAAESDEAHLAALARAAEQARLAQAQQRPAAQPPAEAQMWVNAQAAPAAPVAPVVDMPAAPQPAAEPAEVAEPAHKLNVKPIQWPAPPPPSKIFVTSTSQVPVITDEMLAAHKAQQQAQKAAEAWKKSE